MNLNSRQIKLVKQLKSAFWFKLFTWTKVPMLALSGAKIITLTANGSQVAVPFKYLNKNPFKSMYFAVQAMAAELSTASLVLLALKELEEDVAFIVTASEASFFKKASSKVVFECVDYLSLVDGLQKAVKTGAGVEVNMLTIGKLTSGEEVARFTFTWSFKKRITNQ